MIDYGALPPEINSARMYAGPGAGSMLAAAAAWDGLAAELHSAASSYGSVISGADQRAWLGPSSTAMAAAAAPYVAWMSTTAGQAELAATQAQAAAGAYEAAFATTVPPPVIAANRAQLMTLVATNLFGQNTPAIAANRGPIRRNVGPGRRGDVRLCRDFGGNHREGDAVHRGAADHQHGRVGRAGDRGCPAAGTSTGTGVQSTLSQLISTVHTALQSLTSPGSSTSSTSGLSGILSGLLGGSSSGSSTTGGFLGRAFVRRRPGHRGKRVKSYAVIPGWFSMFMAKPRSGPLWVRR